jgi:hypothetical protein
MMSKFTTALLAAAVAAPMVAAAPVEARPYWQDAQYGYADRNTYDNYGRGADERSYYGHDRSYYGRHVRYQDCRRSSGTTGLLAGGAGGALIGNALGGGTLGTLLGAVGGGLLGKHLDKQHDAEQNYHNGC